MKTLIPAAIRCSLMFTGVAAISLACPASVQAVPTTYRYTGNPFTDVTGPYTTSDFLSGMVTLAGPLPPNFSDFVAPTAFTFSDGVQTITKRTIVVPTDFFFVTGPTGQIISWGLGVFGQDTAIETFNFPDLDLVSDLGQSSVLNGYFGFNSQQPGGWVILSAVADTGSTLSLMTLNLMALGLVARRSQRAAG